MSEREHPFEFDTGEPKKRELGPPFVEDAEATARREAAKAEAAARDAAESAVRVKEIEERLAKEEAEAKAAFESEEARAKAYVTGEMPPDMKEREKRIKDLKGTLKEVKARYNEKAEAQKKSIDTFVKNHPYISIAGAMLDWPHTWPPRVMSWALEKADNIADGVLHKIEGWGDKNAPGWFKWAVDWSLWPIEGMTRLGRQTKPQAEEGAKEKREEKKEAEKLLKGKK